MPASALPVLLILLAGGATALQAPTNARLGSAVGSPVNAALISFLVGTIVLAMIAALTHVRPDAGAVKALPWYSWMGGVYGACFVVAAAWGVPRLGVAMTITLMVGGQLLVSLLLDHFGAMGVPRHPLNLGRIGGVALVIAGVLLVRRS